MYPSSLLASNTVCVVKVTWLRVVVDLWSTLEPRAIAYQLSKWYSFELRKRSSDQQVAIRYKVNLSDDRWLPLRLSDNDLTYCSPMFDTTAVWQPSFTFVVPNVLPVAALRPGIVQFEKRLARQRSRVHFPDEVEGAALEGWAAGRTS